MKIGTKNRIVGKDLLDRFMKINLGKSIALQGNYTNHSIRATVISTLDGDGFEARHIIALSSHKSEQTIKEYSTKCPEPKRKQMFDSLSNAMLPKTKQKKLNPQAVATVTNSDQNDKQLQDINLNWPNFDLQPIDDFSTIDDEELANLVYDTTSLETEQKENQTTNNTAVTAYKAQNEFQLQGLNILQINTQVNTINTTPCMPYLYFPNSNITINYNFGK